jgi:hypothetical protein
MEDVLGEGHPEVLEYLVGAEAMWAADVVFFELVLFRGGFVVGLGWEGGSCFELGLDDIIGVVVFGVYFLIFNGFYFLGFVAPRLEVEPVYILGEHVDLCHSEGLLADGF